ncbi:hypothetical protein GCM10011399_13460 [Subtercola lobariae]|uniref:SGNH hydrolase-type esterase domain-containing protein n=1 Tax=Subtercola lobariae TaxID=1588641 RepID=A0A917B3L7_9MICO|nr:hypothetical protein GCM10011399_13460 [Subtercola lobariae]
MSISVAVAVLAIIAVVVTVAILRGRGTPHIDSGTASPTPATTATGQPSTTPLVVYLGNSFVGGSAQDSGPQDRFPALISSDLNTNWIAITSGGSGYVDPGDDGLTFDDLAGEVPENASLVVIMGSDDDAGYPAAKIMDAALTTLQTIRQRAPQAQVLVISTPWVSADPPAGILTSRDAVSDAAHFDNLPYIDPIADGWWVTGPPEQIGDDGLHPTDLGHAQMAERLEPVIRQLLGQ